MSGATDDEVLGWFRPVPVNDTNFIVLENIRACFEHTVWVILDSVAPSADRTTALRELAAASRTAVFAFTHNQEQ